MRSLSILFFAGLLLGICTFTFAANTSTKIKETNPTVHQINMRLQGQWKLIQQGVKAGKLTKDQADGLKANLKSIRHQEETFFTQNNNHNLTSDQQTQLNALLDKNSTVLGEKPKTSAIK